MISGRYRFVCGETGGEVAETGYEAVGGARSGGGRRSRFVIDLRWVQRGDDVLLVQVTGVCEHLQVDQHGLSLRTFVDVFHVARTYEDPVFLHAVCGRHWLHWTRRQST